MSFCLSISVRDLFSLTNYSLLENHKDIIELLSEGDIKETVKAFFLLKKVTKAKIILTLRPSFQGGTFFESEKKRCEIILKILSFFSPDYLDLETSLPNSFIFFIKRFYPHIEIILSYHNFSKESINLESLFLSMKRECISYYKIASVITNFEDLSFFINFLKRKKNLIMVAIGEKWSWTRILLPFLGSSWSYCALKGRERFGQISLEIINNEYKINRKFFNTPNVYALLGDIEGINRSPGHIFHNNHFSNLENNSLYLKIPINKKELKSFILFSKKFSFFKGFSITRPLKKEIIFYLDQLSPEACKIGAVNTIKVFKQKIFKGYNTDGVGAFDYLEDIYGDLTSKSIAILGSGGASLAILYEGMRRGFKVSIFSRNKQQRQLIEKKFILLKTDDLKNFLSNNFDIIVNTLPPNIDIEFINPVSKNIVFDISCSSFCLTSILQKALKNNSKIAYGYGMFIYQAIYQYNLWYNVR